MNHFFYRHLRKNGEFDSQTKSPNQLKTKNTDVRPFYIMANRNTQKSSNDLKKVAW